MKVEEIKKDFPLLENSKIAYLDSGATTQKPNKVIEEVEEFYKIIIAILFDETFVGIAFKISGYEKKKRFLFWMNISSGSEASIRITSSRESSVTGSFTARTRRKHFVHSCLTESFRAATMPQKGASSRL